MGTIFALLSLCAGNPQVTRPVVTVGTVFSSTLIVYALDNIENARHWLYNAHGIGSGWAFYLWDLIKHASERLQSLVSWILQKRLIPTTNNLLGPRHRRQRKDSWYTLNQPEDCHTFRATNSRNQTVKELAYSPQIPIGSVETIHKNCCRNTRTS